MRVIKVGWQSGDLPSRLRRLAEAAVQQGPEVLAAGLGGLSPGAQLPWRVVTDMLTVAAGKIGDPVLLGILMECDDWLMHAHFSSHWFVPKR